MGETHAIYDEVEEDIRFLTSSKVRGMVLLAVMNGIKNSGEISRETNIDISSVIHAARELEERRYIVDKNGYALTPKGKIMAHNLMNFLASLHTISMDNFWNEHYIDDIPNNLLSRVHMLRNSEIIKDTPTELMRGFMLYLNLLRKSRRVRGVSSIFHPRFPSAIEKLARRKADMEFVITPSIFEKLRETKMKKRLVPLLEKEKLSLFLVEREVKLAFTVTEKFLSFTLYFKNGFFDDNATLISYDEEALQWANSLYNHYRECSKPLSPEDF